MVAQLIFNKLHEESTPDLSFYVLLLFWRMANYAYIVLTTSARKADVLSEKGTRSDRNLYNVNVQKTVEED